jgi:hypothetical protein
MSPRDVTDKTATAAVTDKTATPAASAVTALPARGEVFFDQRGTGRALRVSWHPEVDLLVLSLWREGRCVGTFRLDTDEVPRMVNALVAGLAVTGADGRSSAAARDAARDVDRDAARDVG